MSSSPSEDSGQRGAPNFARIVEREAGLQRRLSARQLAMIAIGGAIGTGLFLGSGFAIGLAGPAVLISYAIGGLITLLVMRCLAEMTVAHPTTGSFGAWAEFYISPLAGFLVRAAYWAGVVLALGTEVSAIAVYMRFWFPVVNGFVWIAGFAVLLILVNATSVRFFGVVEYTFSAMKVTAICAFLFLGGYLALHAGYAKDDSIGLHNYVAHGGFFPKGLWGMWVAVLVSLFSYFSIEMIAIAAGEAEDPKRAIQQAFRATMLRLALFYLGTLTLVLALVPWTITAAGAAQSPFVIVMQQTHLPAAAGVVNFVILAAALSAMNSQLYITARILFSLSRGGLAPRALGKLSRNGVPVRALLCSTLGIAVAAVLNAWYRERAFQLMLSLSIFGPMFTWLMVFVTHLFFRRHWGRRQLDFRMWGFPFTSILGIVLMSAALLTTLFTSAFRPTLIYGVPFLVLLSIGYFLALRRSGAARNAAVEEF